MSVSPKTYVRRPFSVKAVQVTEENIKDVALWCGGTVARTLDDYEALYICVPVKSGRGETTELKAFVGDWVTCARLKKIFKVYGESSFAKVFKLDM